ncbi:MAG TPA: enoyl-CoA hydratase/isomerase family protein [Calditrichia bacterium]|nr:enoyl-CoA hydratase/isomerase family protein [Calditrichia bacterium]
MDPNNTPFNSPDLPVLLALREHVAVITLNRPGVHNAIDDESMTLLQRALDMIEERAEIRSVILTAAGERTFCAGGDIRYFAGLNSREECLEMSGRMQRILNRFYRGDRPVIAAINGQALGGGCEILTATHIRLAVPEARFAFRQAPNGIITGWGGGERLFAQIPRAAAFQLVLSGEAVDSNAALALGFINQVVPRESLMSRSLALAEAIAANSSGAVKAFLEMGTFHEPVGARWETDTFADLWMEPDFRNFIAKFRRD